MLLRAPRLLLPVPLALLPGGHRPLLRCCGAKPSPILTLPACRSNFAPLELADFQRLMNSVKRGDIVGVAGRPGKSKRGELSIFPQSLQVRSRGAALGCAWLWVGGWSDRACRRRAGAQP